MPEQNKPEDKKDKRETRDLEPKKDAKGGGMTSTQPTRIKRQ